LLNIGPYTLDNPLILAPMAGVTDRPFRQLCRRHGAAMAVSEMVIADRKFWHTDKSRFRLDHQGEQNPIAVQIAGGDARMLAEAARANAQSGAQIIDINMGCPARKVCNKAAGSALMKDEALVRDILEAVVAACEVPVTLKMRTGWSPEHKNALNIARMAQDIGITAIAVHGRTRACRYQGQAEYDTIAEIKHQLRIPVLANGDIDSPGKAAWVLTHTGVDGLLIGRAAQGCPWIFDDINHFLRTGQLRQPRSGREVAEILLGHLADLHRFYGERMGPKIARKHVGWYLGTRHDATEFRRRFNTLETPQQQLEALEKYFQPIIDNEEEAA
jgi:tRNA-dihydrouridine synthase B